MSKTDNALSLVVIRYPNLSGAIVIVTATELGRRTGYAWYCCGCLDIGEGGGLEANRTAANEHSSTCRALPQPEHPNTK